MITESQKVTQRPTKTTAKVTSIKKQQSTIKIKFKLPTGEHGEDIIPNKNSNKSELHSLLQFSGLPTDSKPNSLVGQQIPVKRKTVEYSLSEKIKYGPYILDTPPQNGYGWKTIYYLKRYAKKYGMIKYGHKNEGEMYTTKKRVGYKLSTFGSISIVGIIIALLTPLATLQSTNPILSAISNTSASLILILSTVIILFTLLCICIITLQMIKKPLKIIIKNLFPSKKFE